MTSEKMESHNTDYFWILLTTANMTARTSAAEQVQMDL